MRINQILVMLSAFLLLSCAKAEKPKTNRIVEVYNQQDYENKIEIVDTFCISETKRAENDIKNRRYSLKAYVFSGQRYDSYQDYKAYNKILFNKLSQFNIKVDTSFILESCLRKPGEHLFKKYCYQETMKDEILKKFGPDFIDSIGLWAKKQYIIKHPNEIYQYYNDIIELSDFTDNQERKFRLHFKYPNGYIYKNGKKCSSTSASFVLMKDGSIEELTCEVSFANSKNEKFKTYFENELKNFIQKTKWPNPMYDGQPVNSQMHFYFLHK